MTTENRNATSSEKGFTLLELIVAITLVATMAVGIWSIYIISMRTWSRGTDYIDASQRRRNIQDMVLKQIASAFPLTEPPDPVLSGMSGSTSPIFYGTETSFRFVSLNSLHLHDSPGLTLVNYEVTQDPQGTYILHESEERYLGRIPNPESEIDFAEITPLFDNLVQCYFEYHSQEDKEPWVREWNAEERGQLPEAVAINMAAVDTDGNTRSHQIIVPIHATTAALQTSSLIRLGGGAPGRGIGKDIGSNTDEDESEDNLGRRSEFIRRRKSERERKQ